MRQAEVGIAVSRSSDVAKGAASAVLTTEGLANIVDLVKIGRAIYQRVLTWIVNKVSRTILKAGARRRRISGERSIRHFRAWHGVVGVHDGLRKDHLGYGPSGRVEDTGNVEHRPADRCRGRSGTTDAR